MISEDICYWKLAFFVKKPKVRLNTTITVSIRASELLQGCVLTPVIFSVYSNGGTALSFDCHIIKYANDTVIPFMPRLTVMNSDQSAYYHNILRLVS